MVGLDPLLKGTDIPDFDMFGARLTKATFSKILEDLDAFQVQYGTLSMQVNEQARSRYLSGVSRSLAPLKA